RDRRPLRRAPGDDGASHRHPPRPAAGDEAPPQVQTGLPEEARAGQATLRQGPQAPPSQRAMKALVQRVSQAAVDVEGDRVARMGPGMLVLLGVGVRDGEDEADRLSEKVRKLRIFDDGEGRMNEPLGEREVLCVSQFTLYGDARRGNRPSYVEAARP